MNKGVTFLVLGVMALFLISTVSASTLIAGKIYDATNPSHWVTVEGADVTVVCNGHPMNTTSLSDGAYSVTYSNSDDCNNDDSLTVSATKGSLAGSNTGEIHDNVFSDWDLGIVNVPMVPEFGLFAGAVTILSAVGIFFFVRRK